MKQAMETTAPTAAEQQKFVFSNFYLWPAVAIVLRFPSKWKQNITLSYLTLKAKCDSTYKTKS